MEVVAPRKVSAGSNKGFVLVRGGFWGEEVGDSMGSEGMEGFSTVGVAVFSTLV